MTAALAALLIALSACSAIPADPDGTLERVTGGTLRVGVSANPPWTDLPEGANGEPSGSETELVAAFAASLGAEVHWATGGEEQLIAQLERGDLELVIGGLTAQSPWEDRAALTLPYTESRNETGDRVPQVMATQQGENAFLVALERFLLDRH